MPLLELEYEVLPEERAAEPYPELQLYRPALLPRRRYGRSFLASVLLHCACIFGLPPLMDLLPESDAETSKRLLRAMRSLEIRIPDRLYLPPAPAKPEQPRPSQPQTKPAPKPLELAKTDIPPLPQPVQKPLRAPLKRFEPPPGVRRVDADLTLLQAHLPPNLPLATQPKLPQLVLLTGPAIPRPTPRRFVEPGRSATPNVAPRLDAPPQLAPPGASNPDLRISSMLAGPESALLRLPRPNVPARQFQLPAPLPDGRGASVSPTLGEPVNIVALSSDPATLGDKVTIPVGNQIGRLADLPAYTGPAPSLTPDAKRPGSGPAPSASAKEGELAELTKALASLPERYATPIKIEHPASAVFDVVVAQSSADPAFAESAGVLSGQPVYTVYLQVGAPRAWVLQYCIPREAAEAPKVVGGAVNIGAPTPVKAPFPLVTLLPPITMLPRNGYIIVHGSLDTQGQFKGLEVVRVPNGKMKDLILPDLTKWQFRPAVRDGAPIAVEVLLAIPPQDV